MPTIVLKSLSCPQHSELLLLLQHHLIRLAPQNALPTLRFPAFPPRHPSCFPPAQRILLRARDGGQVILTLLIKLIHDQLTSVSLNLGGWMRALEMETRRVRLPSMRTGLSVTMRTVYACLCSDGALSTDGDTCSASSARIFTPSSYSIRLQAPSHLTSHPAQRICVDGRCWCTCERFYIAQAWPPQFGRHRGDGSDCCQRDGVEPRWDDRD
jgi:hypothetical protein